MRDWSGLEKGVRTWGIAFVGEVSDWGWGLGGKSVTGVT